MIIFFGSTSQPKTSWIRNFNFRAPLIYCARSCYITEANAMSLQAWHFSSWLQLDSFPHFKGTKLAFSSICGALLHFWSPSFQQPWESCSLWAAACLKLKTADKILACRSIRNSLCLKKSVQGRHQHFICGSSVVTCGTVSIIYTALRGLIIILQSFTFILVLSKDNYSDNYLGQAA